MLVSILSTISPWSRKTRQKWKRFNGVFKAARWEEEEAELYLSLHLHGQVLEHLVQLRDALLQLQDLVVSRLDLVQSLLRGFGVDQDLNDMY